MSITVTQEKLPNSQLGLQIEIDAIEAQQAFEATVRKYMKTARVPGFRPGKAPRPIVLQYLGKNALKAEALEALVNRSFEAALTQEKISDLGNRQVLSPFDELITQFEPGHTIIFKAAVDVQPEVQLRSDYGQMTVSYSDCEFNATEVDERLEAAREQKATYVPILGRTAQIGDTAVIDFLGCDPLGVEIDGAKGTDFQVELFVDRFIPGFVDGIIGMTVDETRDVPARFPADYAKPELSNQDVLFTITLKNLKEKQLPELDDALALAVAEVETLDQWRDSVTTEIQERVTREKADARDTALLDALLEGTTIELPKTLLEQEFQFLAEQYFQSMQQRGINPEMILQNEQMLALVRENLSNEAVTRLKRTLALAEVAKREQILVTDEEVTPRLAEYARNIQENIDREALVTAVRDEVLTEKILGWLVEHSTMEVLTDVSFDGIEAEVVNDPTAANLTEDGVQPIEETLTESTTESAS